jgi:SAM-dependent methyltransferase
MWRQRLEARIKRLLRRHPGLYARARRFKTRLLSHSAAEHWDRQVRADSPHAPRGWLDWELVEREYIRPQISGDPEVDYLQHFLESHLPVTPVSRALSLGCGDGHLERALLERGAALRIDGLDVSPASIERARELATRAPLEGSLRYRVADLDRVELEPSAYDFVVAKMALHHVERLEHLLDQVRLCLAPGGLLMLNEYVGPARFQWSDGQLALANRLLKELPAEIRHCTPHTRIDPLSVDEMIARDPSESPRSDEILPLVESRFEVLERRDYGGTLLHLLLGELAEALRPQEPEHAALLRHLFEVERQALREGALSSDFTYLVARPAAD